MIVDSSLIVDYPFRGTFTRRVVDESLPLDQRVEVETTMLETECDIQESTNTSVNGVNNVTFNVFFPFDPSVGISLRRGDRFTGNMYGVEVRGEIDRLFPTQLGGCEVHLKDFNV